MGSTEEANARLDPAVLAFYTNTDASLGCYMIGIIINIFFMGMLTIQTWNYYHIFKEDRKLLKILVGVLFAINLVSSSCDSALLYLNFARHFGNFEHFDRTTWLFWTEPGFNGVIAFLVQCFFVHRTYGLMRRSSWRTPYLFFYGCGVLLCLVSSQWLVFALRDVKTMSNVGAAKLEVMLWLIPAGIVDVLITVALISMLLHSKTGFISTDSLIDKLIRLAMETGFLSALTAVLDIIFYLGQSHINMAHMTLQFPLGKLYTHSLMVTLHSRAEQHRHFAHHSSHDKFNRPWIQEESKKLASDDLKRHQASGVIITQSAVIREESVVVEEVKNLNKGVDGNLTLYPQNYEWKVSTNTYLAKPPTAQSDKNTEF